tara:strand:+ start:89 stop:793 length:705 start_codon:yes stop_codon:yes gene_type:complete
MQKRKITTYTELIKKLPEREHFIVIKKETWSKRFPKFKSDIIKWDKDDSIEISRGELFDLARKNKITEKFVIKVLMWGYPTGGRGNNIKTLLQERMNEIVTKLNNYKEKPFIKTEELKDGLEIKGLGLSTMSKFLYFLKIDIDAKDNRSVILDQRIIDVVNDKVFDDFDLPKITSYNAPKSYSKYLEKVSKVAKEVDTECTPGMLEMFLFIFGNKFMLKLAHKLIQETTAKGQG